jgi:hypothetical protein
MDRASFVWASHTILHSLTRKSCGSATGTIYEYACHEGNYAMRNLLAGGRVDAAKRSR